MNQKRKTQAKKELEKIYDDRFKLLKTGKKLRKEFSASLRENPVLGLILKLAILANIGIWTSLGLIVFQQL
jgi:hypothetical protein